MFKILLIIIIQTSALAAFTYGTENRPLLRQGNTLFESKDFVGAEQKYRKALEKDPDNLMALYNLGNALYRQGRLEEAKEILSQVTQERAASDDLRAAGWHNLGNTLLGSGQIPESVDAFKEALRLAPDDDDTRYNLAYALNLLEEPPPDASDQDGDGDNDDQQDQEQGPDEDDGNDDQNRDASPEMQPETGDDQLAERPDQLSPQDAERILEALRQQEQKIQEEINREEQLLEPVKSQREW